MVLAARTVLSIPSLPQRRETAHPHRDAVVSRPGPTLGLCAASGSGMMVRSSARVQIHSFGQRG